MTAAVLKPVGTTAESSEQLMSAMRGQITGRQVFTREVGMGSSLQEEDLALDRGETALQGVGTKMMGSVRVT